MAGKLNEPRPWPIDAPEMRSPKVSLFVIIDGVPMWAASVADKRYLAEETEEPIWATWRGEYSTHVFEVDRGQAELEMSAGPDLSRSADPNLEKMLAWFAEEAVKQGLTARVSHAAGEVSAAKWLRENVEKPKLLAVAQWSLVDDRHPFGWRGNVTTWAQLRAKWNNVLAAWEQAGMPRWDPTFVYEATDG